MHARQFQSFDLTYVFIKVTRVCASLKKGLYHGKMR
jgi:hypothetical protein